MVNRMILLKFNKVDGLVSYESEKKLGIKKERRGSMVFFKSQLVQKYPRIVKKNQTIL